MSAKFENQISVPVLTKDGKHVRRLGKDVHLDLVNVPWKELGIDGDLALVDWSGGKMPTATELQRGVEKLNITLGGSITKQRKTWNMSEETFAQFSDIYKFVEDGMRFSRHLLAQGWFGGIKGDIKITAVPRGTMTAAGLVEDGFGYISAKLAKKGYNGREKTKMGSGRGSYSIFQFIPLSRELKDELWPSSEERINDASTAAGMLRMQSSEFSYKKELVEIDPQMISHPFVVNSLVRSASELLSRLATTPALPYEMRIAVPSEYNVAVNGKFIISRYPKNHPAGTHAIEQNDVPREEIDRIANMEVIQYSISSKTVAAKGCLGVSDKIDGIIICEDDIKMGALGGDVVIPFMAWYDKGSACGVNAEYGSKYHSLDHDGDMVELIDCTDFPVLWDTINAIPRHDNVKLPKSKRPFSKAHLSKMMLDVMRNLIGIASVTNAAAFALDADDQETFCAHMGSTPEALHNRLQYLQLCGENGFKTSVPLDQAEKSARVITANLKKAMGIGKDGHPAPWTMWPGPDAFVSFIPSVIIGWDVNGYVYTSDQVEPADLTAQELHNAVRPGQTGTIAEWCRMTLPLIRSHRQEGIKVSPLTLFKPWAKHAGMEAEQSADAICDWYNTRISDVNFEDPAQWDTFKTQLQNEINVWLERDKISRSKAASALWRAAHSARGPLAGAGVAFLAFPEECSLIVKNKPGLSGSHQCVLNGLRYQLPGVNELDLKVSVVTFEERTSSGTTVIRKAVCAKVKGQRKPSRHYYPENTIGVLAVNEVQVPDGVYRASIKPLGAASHSITLH